MKQVFWGAVLIAGLLCGHAPISCAHSFELVEPTDTGAINWTRRVVQARGTGASLPVAAGTEDGWSAALRNARRHAYIGLLKNVKALRLSRSGRVGGLVADDDQMLARIEELLKSSEIQDTVYRSDGAVEVVRRMPFSGSLSQLILPESIVQLEMKNLGRTTLDPNHRPFTGLVVDARGVDVAPAMCFAIVDEGGREVYGSAYVSREFVVQHGMCGYVTDFSAIEQFGRVGGHPLTVTALGTGDTSDTDIVISNTDAARLRSTVENLFFLRECRVIVVRDPLPAAAGP
jgi:hypothetical protein